MKRDLPEFEPHTDEPLPKSCLAWRRTDRGLTFFIMLLAHSREDIFTIELAWSHHGYLNPDPAIKRESAECIRVPSLSNPSRIERWWEILPRLSLQEMSDRFMKGEFFRPEESADFWLPRVPELVEDAMEQLKLHGLAYFDGVGRPARHGVVGK